MGLMLPPEAFFMLSAQAWMAGFKACWAGTQVETRTDWVLSCAKPHTGRPTKRAVSRPRAAKEEVFFMVNRGPNSSDNKGQQDTPGRMA